MSASTDDMDKVAATQTKIIVSNLEKLRKDSKPTCKSLIIYAYSVLITIACLFLLIVYVRERISDYERQIHDGFMHGGMVSSYFRDCKGYSPEPMTLQWLEGRTVFFSCKDMYKYLDPFEDRHLLKGEKK